MAGIKISDLPVVATPDLTDVFPIDQGAVTYQESLSQVLSLFQTNASGTWGINISGNAATATNANNLLVTQVATNALFYPLFVASSVTGNQAVDLGTGLTFNPSTNTLTTTTFSGALSGNATTSTTATNSNNSAIVDDTTTNATMYPAWVTTTTGNLPLKVSSTKLSFNPSTGTLSATVFSGSFSGTVTNATNIGITDDTTTNATMYPVWVTANTGNLPAKVSSSKITFNPATATLTTTTFSGALSGNATTATSATNVGITDDTTTNATMYPTWVTATTGNLPEKVSSTKLTFNPSTGTLAATTVTGNLIGVNPMSYLLMGG